MSTGVARQAAWMPRERERWRERERERHREREREREDKRAAAVNSIK